MRSKTIIRTDATDEQIRAGLGNYFLSRGYALKKRKNEFIWKKGNGWLTAPQMFNVYKKEDKLIIEGWIPLALLPGVYVGEYGLQDSMGFAMKVGMRKMLLEIIEMFIVPGTEPEGYMPKAKKGK